jgi:transcriptional regulator
VLPMQAAGDKPAHIAKRLGVARSSVYRMLEAAHTNIESEPTFDAD